MPLLQLAASAHSQNQTGGKMGREGRDGGLIKRSRSGGRSGSDAPCTTDASWRAGLSRSQKSYA